MFVDMRKVSRIVCGRLQDYFSFDKQIAELKKQLEFKEDTKDINSTIKSKNKISNVVESEVIRRIMIENRINEKILWKSIIDDVIKGYEKIHKGKHDYIIEKFMNHKRDSDIENELFMASNSQYRYKIEIVCHIIMIALSKDLISISDIIE